ncbi:MAG: DUF6629 family protein [Pseudomonadota bacterium]
MCFSATASFTGSAVIATIGIATLRQVREPRTLLFAAVPMLFALHQFTEGLVWLGLEGRIGKIGFDHVAFLFMLYAHGILPFLMPVAVALMEPPGGRRKAILGLVAAGAVVFAWNASGIIFLPSSCVIEQNSIAYRNPMTGALWISGLYILATCGALLLSSHRVVRTYGVLNVVALSIAEALKQHAFASVWCFYAAIMSVMIYSQFKQLHIDIENPNTASPALRPFLLSWLRLRKAVAARRAPQVAPSPDG